MSKRGKTMNAVAPRIVVSWADPVATCDAHEDGLSFLRPAVIIPAVVRSRTKLTAPPSRRRNSVGRALPHFI